MIHSTDYERLELALERGDDTTALLRAQIDREEALERGAPTDEAIFRPSGMLTRDAFSRALQLETTRCMRTHDPIAVLVVILGDELDAQDELRLALQLRELASNTGDLVGRIENGYAVALPWIDDREIGPIARTFEAIIRAVVPANVDAHIGSVSTVPTTADLDEFVLPAVRPLRMPALTRPRAR
jgi:hypothetical protein